jgi:hypothetical protein
VVSGDEAAELLVMGGRFVLVMGDQPAGAFRATELPCLLRTQGRVMDGKGESGTPARGRKTRQPGQERGAEAAEDDPGDPVREKDGAGLADFADVVEEGGDEEVAILLALGEEAFADAAEVTLIEGRQLVKDGGLVGSQESGEESFALRRGFGQECG